MMITDCRLQIADCRPPNCAWTAKPCCGERGYALVALLALMTILLLFAAAAAPSIRQQTQREREKEAIFRGEEVADAIRLYYLNHGAAGPPSLPTSMDQLLEGIPKGTKKVQILRAEAARDPLSASGEWSLIGLTSEEFIKFERSLMIYSGGTGLRPRPPFDRLGIPVVIDVLDTGSTETAPCGEDASANSTGPFVGVASHNRCASVLTYYGIDRHDRWVFTPIFR